MKSPILHSRKDALLTSNVTLPATGQTVESDVIDLGQYGGIDEAMIWVEIPALASLAAGKKITVTFQSSPDNETFTDIEHAPAVSALGVDTDGSEPVSFHFRIPSNAERWIKAVIKADTSSGNVTASTAEISVRV